METMKKQIPPALEEEYINMYGAFGWNLRDSRETYNKSSYLERDGDDINQVVETTHFVTLIFERDTGMRDYAALASLQKKFDELGDPRLIAPITFGKVFLGVIAVLLFAGWFRISREGLLLWALAVGVIVWRIMRIKKWRKVVAEVLLKREVIAKQALAIG